LGLIGAGDRLLCSPRAGSRFLAEVPDARIEVVGQASGLAFDPDHMGLITDLRARPVWQRIADFVTQQVA